MRILLINVAHTAIGSRIPKEHLPPLGLLAVGGPLIDAGHIVRLLDADIAPVPTDEIISATLEFRPKAILLGHSGSSSAHPVISTLTRALKIALPDAIIIYGGVYPTFSWESILNCEPQIDIIVRGEGEETTLELIDTIEAEQPLKEVKGIAFRNNHCPYATPVRQPAEDLDKYRIAWELIDHTKYSYWGDRRAVVIQFSRGCPHSCSYCGQHDFWEKWPARPPPPQTG